jgi:hypothetical protein
MISVGDVWTFALEQALFGQQIINTFALRVTTVPANTTESAFITELWETADQGFNDGNNIANDIRQMQSIQVGHRNWHVKRVTNVLSNTFVIPVPGQPTGLLNGDCETANVALSVTRKGLGAGRRSRGRVAIAGITTLNYAAGKFGSDILINAVSLSGDIAGIKSSPSGIVYEMGYWSPGSTKVVDGVTVITLPLFTYCVSAGPRDTVRVQRSRTVGVGT